MRGRLSKWGKQGVQGRRGAQGTLARSAPAESRMMQAFASLEVNFVRIIIILIIFRSSLTLL